jgi:RNA polymerase sigma-70 factor (ECF subfamily)
MTLEAELIEHRSHLLNYAKQLTGGDPDTAEDLVQEAHYRALLNRERLRSHTAIKAWLYIVVRNEFLSRKRKNHWLLYTLDHEEIPEPSTRCSCEGICDLANVSRAIGELPTTMRDVLIALRVDELSYEETAGKLGLPVGTVKSRMSRAEAKLKELVREE